MVICSGDLSRVEPREGEVAFSFSGSGEVVVVVVALDKGKLESMLKNGSSEGLFKKEFQRGGLDNYTKNDIIIIAGWINLILGILVLLSTAR